MLLPLLGCESVVREKAPSLCFLMLPTLYGLAESLGILAGAIFRSAWVERRWPFSLSLWNRGYILPGLVQARAIGKISQYIETASTGDAGSSLRKQIEVARSRVALLESELDPEAIREKLNAFTNIIGRYMNDYSDRLELEHRGARSASIFGISLSWRTLSMALSRCSGWAAPKTGSPRRPESKFLAEPRAIDSVTIADQVTTRCPVREYFHDLLSRPFRSRVRSHVEVQNLSPAMLQHHEDEENLQSRRGNGEEVD
jgi:hypothetical protein